MSDMIKRNQPDPKSETLEAIWASIRDAHQRQAVHEAKCDGRYAVIEQRLAFVIYLLSGIAAAGGSYLAAKFLT